ncbi:hypothetical protein TTHERM_00975340 (macronuclear) [Tetrahymena thermophila SB210]|uniref:Uncharacterized protein n=1 Tax=Tetrahymena thermophila (strain SB210) TaxID=312017 RepID=Q22WQ8_TETTS|nr:hypothetical protein TTHERM_00975340 [Tetrahymena thermophila SB210]EAR89734.2 hypothetical protein TTHERM_00975340 [Tetrahymena thermophila SB210]|eukprot:XP_001009979.2 hypothetical protein TTHERM_00975340 [Tetrahymena thermophila SB210]
MQLQLISRDSNYFQIQQQKIYPNYSSFQNLTQPQQVDLESSNIELEENNNQNMEYQNNIFSGSNQMNEQNQPFNAHNNQQTMKIMFNGNQNNDNFRFNNYNQIKNNIFEPASHYNTSNNQMEVIENVNSSQQEVQEQNEDLQQQNEEREMLRKCISDVKKQINKQFCSDYQLIIHKYQKNKQMMSKKQENCRSKKRYNILNLHRKRIIEDTLDLIYYDPQYFTTEEFEYRVCMNIEKLVQEQEEQDQMKYYYDQELQKAEDEYYRKQIEQFKQNQDQEMEEDEDDDNDSGDLDIIQLNNIKFNQNNTQTQNQNNF